MLSHLVYLDPNVPPRCFVLNLKLVIGNIARKVHTGNYCELAPKSAYWVGVKYCDFIDCKTGFKGNENAYQKFGFALFTEETLIKTCLRVLEFGL